MHSAISIQPITSSQFLSVCNYITSFGIFLNNLGLIKIDERNQTVPVLNALFEYLNQFENQSEPKIQLLRKLFNETVHSHTADNEKVIDMKVAEKHYRYVINMALFSHYGYITGYLAEIINKTESITPLILKRKVFQHLPNSYINNDQCSLTKKSSKLTLLAIERIFVDYILPTLTETWISRRNLGDRQKCDFQLFKRLKRNVPEDSDDDDDDRLVIDERRQSVEDVSSSSEGKQRGSENIENNVLIIDDSQEDINVVKDRDQSDDYWLDISDARLHSRIENYQKELKDIKENVVLVNESHGNNRDDSSDLLFDSSNIPNKIRKVDNSGSSISVNVFDEVQDDIPSTSRKALTTISRNRVEEEKTERLQAIEKAANFISPTHCKPISKDFMQSVQLLKGYLLKLKKQNSDISNVPTYDMLAKDYCSNNFSVPDFYGEWQINGEYIDDVLYKTKFNVPKNLESFFSKSRHRFSSHEAFQYYTSNLPVLQGSIRFEDFYSIWRGLTRKHFIPQHKDNESRNQILAAIHRLALRQCNEEGINKDPITLYYATISINDVPVRCKKIRMALNMFKRFSLFPNVEVSGYLKQLQNNSKNLILYKIQLTKPVCGVVDLQRIKPVKKGSHILIFNMIFKLISHQVEIFNNQTVTVVTLIPLKYAPKENNMVKIVAKINEILPTITNFYIDEI